MNSSELSGDETLVLVICAVVGMLAWMIWILNCFRLNRLISNRSPVLPGLVAPVLCAGLLFVVLRKLAAEDVRYSFAYLAFYMVMGAAWVGLGGIYLLAPLGLGARDDWLERGNPAAACAIMGAWVGLTFAFAGANVGNGPGWWVVVFSAGLATGSLLLAWVVLAKSTDLADAIGVDRDIAAGLRAGGFFLAGGLVLGAAAAGDWVSGAETLKDFTSHAWPALILVAAAIVSEKLFHPQTDRDLSSIAIQGMLPALAYLALAGATLVFYPVPTS